MITVSGVKVGPWIICILAVFACLLFPKRGDAQNPLAEALLNMALAKQVLRNASAATLREQARSFGTAPTPGNVQRIISRLGSQFKRDFNVTVLRDDTFNAACYPNGEITVNTGLLEKLGRDDDALAAILGHEIAHFTHEHSVNRFRRAIVLEAGLRSLALRQDASNPLLIKAAQAVMASYSRDDELEADRLGFVYLVRAGFDPEGSVRAFEVMASLGPETSSFFASHPRSAERAQKQRQYMAAFKAGVPLEWIAEGKTTKDIEDRIGQAPDLPVINSAFLSVRLNHPTSAFTMKVFPRMAVSPLVSGYVAIFSHTPDGKLRRLFPNPFVTDGFCPKEEWAEIPSLKYRTPKGDFIRLRWEKPGDYGIIFVLTEKAWASENLDGQTISRADLAVKIGEACKDAEMRDLQILELTVKK